MFGFDSTRIIRKATGLAIWGSLLDGTSLRRVKGMLGRAVKRWEVLLIMKLIMRKVMDAVLELIGSEVRVVRVRGLTFVILPIY